MPSMRRKHWTSLNMGTEHEDASRMTTACLYEKKETLTQDAEHQHQVEAPRHSVPSTGEQRHPVPTSDASHLYNGHLPISSPLSHHNDHSHDLNVAETISSQSISRQNGHRISSSCDIGKRLVSPSRTSRSESQNERLTLYFRKPQRQRNSLPCTNSLNRITCRPPSKSIDVASMNGIRCNGPITEKGSDGDIFFQAEDPVVPNSMEPVESPGPPDHFPKTVKSPDTQSIETFLSAKSHLSIDEVEGNSRDEVEGLGHLAEDGVDGSGDCLDYDDVDGPIHAETSTTVNLSPNASSTSSTLSPGSSCAPGLVVVPPSPSSSQTVSSGGSGVVRPNTLGVGAVPKAKKDSLSPSYRPMDKKGVSMEAMLVLDSMLKRSYSQNDASPLMHHYQILSGEMDRIEETDPEAPTISAGRDVDEDSLPDYEGAHSPVSKSNSIVSSGSQSSSFKHRIVPMTKKDVDDALQKDQQKKKHLVKRRRKSTSSSSTSTDEEVQNERQERRKRKSLFKKAKEKLRKSLKHRRESSIGGEGKKSSDKSSSTLSPGAELRVVVEGQTDTRPEKDGATPTGRRDTKNLFESLIQYIRSGKAKLKRKSKKPISRSKSVEEIPARDDTPVGDQTSWSLEKRGGRRVTHQYQFRKEEEKPEKEEEKGGIEEEQEDQEEDSADGPARYMRLPGLRRFRPSINEEQGGIATAPVGGPELGSDLPTFVIADGLDDVDHYSPSVAEKPHLQRTHSEREHVYERVADQLAAIADNYDISSPLSPDRNKQLAASAEAGEPIVLPGSKESSVDHEIKKELGLHLQKTGDRIAKEMPELNNIAKDLVRNVSYTHFQNVLHQQMGGDNNIQQIALYFNVVKRAVQTVGYGTAMAMQLKEMSLRYFEDRYADWVIGQGGWESIAEETDLSSEVD